MKSWSAIAAFVVGGTLAGCSASTGAGGTVTDDQGGTGGAVPTNGGTGTGGSGGTIANGGSGATIETGGTGAGGTGGDMCGLQNFNLERKPAEVLLLLDRSASMQDPPDDYTRPDGTPETALKWDLIIPALLDVVQATDAMVSWGLKVFPEGDRAGACSAGSVTSTIDVEIAEHNAQAVVERIQQTNDEGDGTPTGDAMRQAVSYLESRAGLNDNDRYILLATDGEPSCINVSETSSGSEGQDSARPYAIDAISAAAAAGFHTFVVGVGTNKESAVNTLEAMSLAGQEPAPCANPIDPCFYLGNSQAQLAEALRSIATAVSTCVFPLNEKAPQPENIAVHVDGMKVPPDDDKINGWSYQDDEQLIVEVYGEWCDVIKGSSSSTVEITFGCPDIVVR